MATRNILCAAAIAAAGLPALPAHAATDWLLGLAGHGVYAAGGTEGCSDEHPEQCVRDTDWRGTLLVVTDGSADGTYSGGDILEIRLDANLSALDFTSFPEGPTWQTAPSVTIAGGAVTALTVRYTDDGQDSGGQVVYFIVDGLQASYETYGYHGNYASLAGLLSNVPEPAAAACVLAGLLALARARSRA